MNPWSEFDVLKAEAQRVGVSQWTLDRIERGNGPAEALSALLPLVEAHRRPVATLTAETTPVAPSLKKYQSRRARQTKGYEAGKKGARIQRSRPADERGLVWRPNYTSRLNREVFPKYGLVPAYVTPLVPLMGKAARGAVIAIGSRVDRNGEFRLPRRTLASLIGTGDREAKEALRLLERAGIIAVKYQGARRQARVWRYVTVAEHDAGRARRVLAGT
jgi:hypothetical protein